MSETPGTSDHACTGTRAGRSTSRTRTGSPRLTLHGLKPPDVAGARVLEIGCAAGGNLIPMALAWPKARFVADLTSPRARWRTARPASTI